MVEDEFPAKVMVALSSLKVPLSMKFPVTVKSASAVIPPVIVRLSNVVDPIPLIVPSGPFRTTVEVPPLNVPLFVQSPETVNTRPEPPFNVEPSAMKRSPVTVQSESGVTPPAPVLVISTDENVRGPPATVMLPVPPKSTSPVLENEEPPSDNVTAFDGSNMRVPSLLTVPLFVNVPPIVYVYGPPMKLAPAPTMKSPVTSQSVFGAIPPVLFTLTLSNVGDVRETKFSATDPLKLTVPVLTNPESSSMLWAAVPVKVTVPLLRKDPIFKKSPENVVLVPAA